MSSEKQSGLPYVLSFEAGSVAELSSGLTVRTHVGSKRVMPSEAGVKTSFGCCFSISLMTVVHGTCYLARMVNSVEPLIQTSLFSQVKAF